jgi:hypothetical protein
VYLVYSRRWLEVEGVVVVVGVVVRDESGEVGILVYVEYGDLVEKWVGQSLVLARVSYGVLPYCDVHANGGSYLCVVLCYVGGGWWERCDDGLLECL